MISIRMIGRTGRPGDDNRNEPLRSNRVTASAASIAAVTERTAPATLGLTESTCSLAEGHIRADRPVGFHGADRATRAGGSGQRRRRRPPWTALTVALRNQPAAERRQMPVHRLADTALTCRLDRFIRKGDHVAGISAVHGQELSAYLDRRVRVLLGDCRPCHPAVAQGSTAGFRCSWRVDGGPWYEQQLPRHGHLPQCR